MENNLSRRPMAKKARHVPSMSPVTTQDATAAAAAPQLPLPSGTPAATSTSRGSTVATGGLTVARCVGETAASSTPASTSRGITVVTGGLTGETAASSTPTATSRGSTVATGGLTAARCVGEAAAGRKIAAKSAEPGEESVKSDENSDPVRKRKGEPQKLAPEQLGTTMPSEKSENSSDDDDEHDHSQCGSDSSSSSAGEDLDHAELIASLLRSEHGEALRAYLARHEIDVGDIGQSVPMNMPKPPGFPDEMADFMRSPQCKSIIVLAGAGISVSSGIPDFRSAGVGLYDTLRPELLTASEVERAMIADDPTLALDRGIFLENPLPMLETKREFILGTHERTWRATLAHRFVEMLHTKLGKLTRVYTQNIDGLELQTATPREKVVNVHGSMGAAACEACSHDADFDEFCDEVRRNIKDITGKDADAPEESLPIRCKACGAPAVKPTIVLFRGSMPKEFHVRMAQDLPDCDLLIIMGTSLTVAPANSLVYRVPPTALRMVMNNERIGRRLGIMYGNEAHRDVFASGRCDETCLSLAEKLGWMDDLRAIADELPEESARTLNAHVSQTEGQKEDKEEEI